MRVGRIAGAALGLVLALGLTSSASAGPGWQQNSLQVTRGGDGPKFVAALDALMASEVGQQLPGRMLLLGHVADGGNPATHSVAIVFKSVADSEAQRLRLFATPAYREFLETVSGLSRMTSQTRFRTLVSWGDVQDSDVVWMTFAFDVAEPGAFAAALARFQATETGKAFPGQGHLSQVVAGGPSTVSHVITVGYRSEAEMEAWNERVAGTPAWEAFLRGLGGVSEFHGGSLSRQIKAYGTMSLKEATSR